MSTQQDSGLWKRGIVLLILVGTIAGIALFFVLWRPGNQTAPGKDICPELLTPMLSTAQAPFPAALNWGVLYQFSQNLPSPRGWEIRYNATMTLARRGNPELPLEVVCEMLDEEQQMRNFRVCLKNGQPLPDEAAARSTVYNAMMALEQWWKHPQVKKKFTPANADVQKVVESVSQLTRSTNSTIRTKAEAVKLLLEQP